MSEPVASRHWVNDFAWTAHCAPESAIWLAAWAATGAGTSWAEAEPPNSLSRGRGRGGQDGQESARLMRGRRARREGGQGSSTHMLDRPWPTVDPTATPAAVDMMLPIMLWPPAAAAGAAAFGAAAAGAAG